jgi:hypothetical protein
MRTAKKIIPAVSLPFLELSALAPDILLRGSPDIQGSLFAQPDDELMVLTPEITPGRRIRLYVSKEDQAKTRRGKGWKCVVTDVPSGLLFAIRSAPCGLGCHCAAVVVWCGERP